MGTSPKNCKIKLVSFWGRTNTTTKEPIPLANPDTLGRGGQLLVDPPQKAMFHNRRLGRVEIARHLGLEIMALGPKHLSIRAALSELRWGLGILLMPIWSVLMKPYIRNAMIPPWRMQPNRCWRDMGILEVKTIPRTNILINIQNKKISLDIKIMVLVQETKLSSSKWIQ